MGWLDLLGRRRVEGWGRGMLLAQDMRALQPCILIGYYSAASCVPVSSYSAAGAAAVLQRLEFVGVWGWGWGWGVASACQRDGDGDGAASTTLRDVCCELAQSDSR